MSNAAETKPRARRALAAIGVGIAAIALAAMARGPALRATASFLIVGESPTDRDWILPLDGDGMTNLAGHALARNPGRRAIFIVPPPNRLQRLGIVPGMDESARAEMAGFGVGSEQIEFIAAAGRGRWDEARALREWLDRRPEATVAALVDAFGSRRDRAIFARALGAERMRRVRIAPLRDRQLGPNNWHRTRMGVRAVFRGYLAWALAAIGSDEDADRGAPEWDPDAYERSLAEARR